MQYEYNEPILYLQQEGYVLSIEYSEVRERYSGRTYDYTLLILHQITFSYVNNEKKKNNIQRDENNLLNIHIAIQESLRECYH